jgi:hypothetical protein
MDMRQATVVDFLTASSKSPQRVVQAFPNHVLVYIISVSSPPYPLPRCLSTCVYNLRVGVSVLVTGVRRKSQDADVFIHSLANISARVNRLTTATFRYNRSEATARRVASTRAPVDLHPIEP